MRTLQALFVLAVLASPALAQPLVLNLVPPAQPVIAGDRVTVDLMVLNRGAAPQEFTAPAAAPAALISGSQSWPIELHAAGETPRTPAVIQPGTFATHVYTFTMPAAVSGTAIIEVRLAGALPARGVIDLPESTPGRPTEPRATEPGRVTKPTTNLARAEPAASVIQRTFANRLAPHEPIYFIYGADTPGAKLQFSFKYKLLAFTEPDVDAMARTLQFGFTQRSLWEINRESSPFYDTSYIPELMYESLAPRPEERETWFTWLGYQAGYKHESNGRDGPGSRSLNTVYVRPVLAFGRLDGWHLLLIPELFTYVADLDDNTDLKDYRGYGRLNLVFGKNDGLSLMMSAWAGKEFDHGTVQIDLTLPIRTRMLNFETYLLVQYFNGYGESLRDYRDRSETIRGGISLVR